MPAYAPGDIVIVEFPFTIPPATKRRPGLVLFDASDEDYVVARVTSAEPQFVGDVALQDWRAEGLLLPSTVRLTKLATISGQVLSRVAGQLTPRDTQSIAAELNTIVARVWPSR